jgi:uncharacterized membrane-anchored protein YitT (DUF2179 family)
MTGALKAVPRRLWPHLSEWFSMTAGGLLLALNLRLFLAPAQIAPGGVSGTAILVNALTGWPIGIFMLALNLPLLALGFKYLGGRRFLTHTLYTIILYNLGTDLLTRWLPPGGLTDDLPLNALYSGVLGGLAAGLVYRGGGSVGGTGILSRILQRRTGLPISQLYVLTDGLVVLGAVFVFGWEKALYALITLFIWGLAADYLLEGPSVVRTVFIITDHPEAVAHAVLQELHLGLTAWSGRGMFTGEGKTILFCTLSRPEVKTLRELVERVDPEAFLVIGQGHQALGGRTRGSVPLPEPDSTQEVAPSEGETGA